MRAMVLHQPGQPLVAEERPDPTPGPGEVRIRVLACAVCRTDLHLVDGELPPGGLPRIPGHEIVGCIDMLGPGAEGLRLGQRVGVVASGLRRNARQIDVDHSIDQVRPGGDHGDAVHHHRALALQHVFLVV